jgi:hypothetical protein
MQTSNTSKSTSAQTPCLRRAQSLPNELGSDVVGRPLFWFKAPKRKIAQLEKETSRDPKPPRRRLPLFPHLVRFRSNKWSSLPEDLQMPDLLSSKPSFSDSDEPPQTIETVETTDTTEDDTWTIYSTDDEDNNDALHGLSFLDESDQNRDD